MRNPFLTGPRVAAIGVGTEGTNSGCHGNNDGVDPNDEAILAHVRVMILHWGKFYEEHPDVGSNSYVLCRDLVTGPYFNGLAQYGVGRGSMAGSGNINFTLPPATLSRDEACDTLLSWLRDNTVFGPAIDETSLLYVLFLAPETKPTISSGQDDFCGYHHWAKLHDESRDSDVFWAIIRTDHADQTSGAAFIKSVSACVSHEIAEAVTSRDGRGYFKGNCEIGDLCEQNPTHEYRGWDVEQYWSQWDGACVNGDSPVSVRRFLQARGLTGGSLRTLNTPVINVEFIATQFRA